MHTVTVTLPSAPPHQIIELTLPEDIERMRDARRSNEDGQAAALELGDEAVCTPSSIQVRCFWRVVAGCAFVGWPCWLALLVCPGLPCWFALLVCPVVSTAAPAVSRRHGTQPLPPPLPPHLTPPMQINTKTMQAGLVAPTQQERRAHHQLQADARHLGGRGARGVQRQSHRRARGGAEAQQRVRASGQGDV